MATLELLGHINEQGDLEIGQPLGLRAGTKVKITITELADTPDQIPWEEQPWTHEELDELMKHDPKTGAEIVEMIRSGELDTSAWTAMNITDPVVWLEEVRRKEQEERSQDR